MLWHAVPGMSSGSGFCSRSTAEGAPCCVLGLLRGGCEWVVATGASPR